MDTINTRIADLIVESGKTKTECANRLNVTPQFVSSLCNGKKSPSDRTIADICREFNVNETWLRTGEGEMFRQIDGGDELKRIFEELSVSEDQTMKRLIRAYWRLSESEKAVFRQMLDNMVEEYEEDSPAPEQAKLDLAAKVAELERQNDEKDRRLQELSARLSAMEEEDELFWHPDTGNLA